MCLISFPKHLKFLTPCLPWRVALMILLLSCLNQSWMIENPGSSCLLLHPWLQWALRLLRNCSKVSFLNQGLVFEMYFPKCLAMNQGIFMCVLFYDDFQWNPIRYTNPHGMCPRSFTSSSGCDTTTHHLWSRPWWLQTSALLGHSTWVLWSLLQNVGQNKPPNDMKTPKARNASLEQRLWNLPRLLFWKTKYWFPNGLQVGIFVLGDGIGFTPLGFLLNRSAAAPGNTQRNLHQHLFDSCPTSRRTLQLSMWKSLEIITCSILFSNY